MSETQTRTFYRIETPEGSPSRCVAVECQQGFAGAWHLPAPSLALVSVDGHCMAGHAPDPDGAWVLALEQVRKTYCDAENARLRAFEVWLELHEARAAAKKGEADGDE